MKKLWYFKLANGDEVISETSPSTDSNFYCLSNPLEVKDMVDEKTGKSAVILQDYIPYTQIKTSVKISKTQVITQAIVEGSMSEYYSASLEFANLYGIADTEDKILKASNHMRKYINQLLYEDLKEESFLEEILDDEDIEFDDELFEQVTSANTTYH